MQMCMFRLRSETIGQWMSGLQEYCTRIEGWNPGDLQIGHKAPSVTDKLLKLHSEHDTLLDVTRILKTVS
jgi:hypothetical protein